eukprot:15311288-Ditylum_brightwellii.AAC.1
MSFMAEWQSHTLGATAHSTYKQQPMTALLKEMQSSQTCSSTTTLLEMSSEEMAMACPRHQPQLSLK